MNRRLFVVLALLTAMGLEVRAQWDVQFSDYTTLRSFYNPAVSGTDGLLNVSAAFSMQKAGYKHAPSTLYVGADMPVYFLSARHGAGVSFLSDKVGIFTTTKISLQYAYNLKVGKRGRLAVGVQGGMMQETVSKGDIELEDNSDPAFPSSEQKGNKLDLGAGLFFYHPKVWLGASSQHLLAPTIKLAETNEVSIKRMYYLMGGCNIRLKNTFLTLQPSFLVMTDMDYWREDIQCKLKYEWDGKAMFIGAGYSPDVSATFMIGGNFHGVSLCYSYQMYTSGIDMVNGSHELSLVYQTELDLFKKGRNKHKSVRFL